jgi:hypothetical protein
MAVTKRAKTKTAKRAPPPAKKAKLTVSRSKARAKNSSSQKSAPIKASPKRTVAVAQGKRRTAPEKTVPAAAPLLAAAPKKVGKVAPAAKPDAPYQPKTAVAPLATSSAKTTNASSRSVVPPAPTAPVFDPLALAGPWLLLGAKMAMANLDMQARMAKAAMSLPPAAIAMRQGSAAYRTWLGLVKHATPAKD